VAPLFNHEASPLLNHFAYRFFADDAFGFHIEILPDFV
jgi:hypothetical protein